MMGTRWTQAEKDALTRSWTEGKTVSEIADTLGKSNTAVKNQRRSLGLPARRTGDLTEKVRIGLHPDEHALLRAKAKRENQTIPGRIRHLIREDLKQP